MTKRTGRHTSPFSLPPRNQPEERKEKKSEREIIIIRRNVGETCGKLTGENHKSVKPKKTVRQTCAGILGYLSRWPPLFFVFFFVWGLSSLRPSPDDDKPREPRNKIRVCAAVI